MEWYWLLALMICNGIDFSTDTRIYILFQLVILRVLTFVCVLGLSADIRRIFVGRLVFILMFVLMRFAVCIAGLVLLLIFIQLLICIIMLPFSFVFVSGSMVVLVLVQIFVLMHYY